jgi:hypothetical protein
MRPTPEEEIRGIAEIIRRQLAPQLGDDYSHELAGHLAEALDRIAAGVADATLALERESASLAALLPQLEATLAELGAAALSPPAEPTEPAGTGPPPFVAAHERNASLRARLAAAIRTLDGLPPSPAVNAALALCARQNRAALAAP